MLKYGTIIKKLFDKVHHHPGDQDADVRHDEKD